MDRFWEFADLGFDTTKKLWFIQLFNETNQPVGTYFASSVILRKGKAIQYQWKDSQGRPFWHIRERFFEKDVEKFDAALGGAIMIDFKEVPAENIIVPVDYSYLLYAYHLTGEDAPMGFVEFYDSSDGLIKKIDQRWIIIEGISRRTHGEFPDIRLRAEKSEITGIVVTRTAIILKG